MNSTLSRAARIENALRAALAPAECSVIDESSFHAGHAGAQPGGETHFRLRVVSGAFAGKSRLERQRLINALLNEEFTSGLHALAMELKAPSEA